MPESQQRVSVFSLRLLRELVPVYIFTTALSPRKTSQLPEQRADSFYDFLTGCFRRSAATRLNFPPSQPRRFLLPPQAVVAADVNCTVESRVAELDDLHRVGAKLLGLYSIGRSEVGSDDSSSSKSAPGGISSPYRIVERNPHPGESHAAAPPSRLYAYGLLLATDCSRTKVKVERVDLPILVKGTRGAG
jgi:hypothetical protein